MAIGTMGHPVLVAILKLPSWKGSISSSLPSLLRVPSGKIQIVQEQAMEISHPVGKKGNRLHFFFGDIACSIRAENIGEKDIKKTSVVSYIQNCLIRGNLFMANNRNMSACDFQDQPEDGLNDPQRADILFLLVGFPEDPLPYEYGDRQDQKSNYNNTNDDKAKHKFQFLSFKNLPGNDLLFPYPVFLYQLV